MGFTVAVVTGSRSEYGILRPVLREMGRRERLRPRLIVTGMHLEMEFGYTVEKIKSDGFEIAGQFPSCPRHDTTYSMAGSVAKSILGCARILKRMSPDVMLVLGDRPEILGSTIAAAYMGVPVAHIHGGERTGNVDDLARNAITKMSHIHLAATEGSAQAIRGMGERKDRVFVVGAPGLDEVIRSHYTEPEELARKYDFRPNRSLALLVQHPVTSQRDQAGRQMAQTLDALSETRLRSIIVYPNADAGGRTMIKVIKSYCQREGLFSAYPSLPREDYLGLLRAASVMVGNSSSGIIEAPSFHLPVVNIGIRQHGRERACNVVDVPHDKSEIVLALHRCLEDGDFASKLRECRNPWGDGRSGPRIADILIHVLASGEDLMAEKLGLEGS